MAGVNSSSVANSEQLLPSNVLIGLIIVKCTCCITGVLGNIGVIVYNVFLNHTKTPTSYFVINLAITDIFACLTIYPIWIAEFAQITTGTEGNEKFFCKISAMSGSMNVFLSILTLLAIRADRFIYISWPLKYRMIITWPQTYHILFLIWFSVIIFAPFLAVFTTEGEVRAFCQTSLFVSMTGLLVYFCIPAISIFVLNYKTFKIARDQRRKTPASSAHGNAMVLIPSPSHSIFRRRRMIKDLKVIKIFAIVIGVSLRCLFPFTILLAVKTFLCSSCVPAIVHIILGDLVGVNSIANPFIYSIRQREYRKAFGRLLTIIIS